jgi:hypothetical protein
MNALARTSRFFCRKNFMGHSDAIFHPVRGVFLDD